MQTRLTDILELSPEEKKKRRENWKEKQRLLKEGKDADRILAQERALKALILLKKHVEGTRVCSETERAVLSAIVLERCKDSFFFFCKHVLEMDLLTDVTHKRWCEAHQKTIKDGKKRVMRLKPRATFKTSVYGIGTVLWLFATVSPQIRIFYTSANALLLNEVSDKLNQYIGSSKNETLYSLIFGIIKDDNAKNTSDVINIKGRSGKGFSLIFRTAGGSSVGAHPHLIIIDDCLDANDRESQATREGKEAWVDSLIPLIVPFHDPRTGIILESVHLIGTRWHYDDVINYLLKRNETLPDERKWDIESESICDENGNSNYPDFISNEKIAEIKSSISDVLFSCQYMNNPLSTGMNIFDLKKLTFVRREQINLELGEIGCFMDPSLGKSSSDFPMTVWTHVHDNKITIIDCIDQKIELSLIVHQIAAKNANYGCRNLTFENNGITLIEESLREAHARINHRILLNPVHHSGNKHERICSIQPDLYSGRVQFLSDYLTRYPEFMNQLAYYPVWKFDDAPDVLELCLSYYRKAHFKFIRYEECL